MVTLDTDSNEVKYRQYLKDVADDENFDLNTLEDFKTYCEVENERMNEVYYEKIRNHVRRKLQK